MLSGRRGLEALRAHKIRMRKRPIFLEAFPLCFRLPGLAFGLAGLCFGSAFSVAELGARAAGMGTAFIATADDGSAIFYNPAGIAFQPGRKMEMDTATVVGLFRFTPSATPVGQVVPAEGYSGAIKPHFIPLAFLYATAQYNDRITFGFGAFTPFGLSTNFDNFHDSDPNLTKFVGRFAGTSAAMQQYWFQPTVSYKLTKNMAIGVGPAFVHTHLIIQESILNPLGDGLTFGRDAAAAIFPGVPQEQAAEIIARLIPEGRSRVAGTANSPGGAAGFLYKSDRFKTDFGLSWRSPVTSHLSGKASFAFDSGPYALEQYIGPGFLSEAFPDQHIKGEFTTPATYGVGLANYAFFHTRVSLDVRMQDYTRFSTVPIDFPINSQNTRFPSGVDPGETSTAVALDPEKRLIFDFHNSWNIAFGVERPISPTMTVRMGYLWDKSPVPDKSVGPLFPDANRNSFTVGASQKRGNKELSLFYEAMFFENRITNVAANDNIWTNGDYHNFANLFGVALRFNVSDTATIKKQK